MMRLLSLALAVILGLGGGALAQVNPPAPPVANPACTGGNSVVGYTAYGTPMVCGTALASGSIANGASQLGVYIGTNAIGPLTPSGDVAFASPSFTVNSARAGKITIPNVTDTVALLTTAQTLTAKTVNCANNTCTVRANLDLTGTLAAANFPALTGDVTNAAGSLATTVAQLQGRPLAATAPTLNQLMGWLGSTWGPVNAPVSGINALTQDVTASGTGSQPATVVGLRGRPISATAPTANQVLQFDGTSWTPGAGGGGGGGGINELTADVTAGPGTGSQMAVIAAGAVTSGKMALGAAAVNVGALNGDLTGTLPAPVVAGLRGRPISLTAPTTSQVLQWDGSSWSPGTAANGGINQLTADVIAGPGIGSQPATIATGAVTSGKMAAGAASANVGALGGDLTGTLPMPVVAQLQGRPFASTAPTTGQLIGYNGSTWGPVNAPTSGINQLTGDATAGPGTGSQPITLAATGIAAGSYQFGTYCATFDLKGRATSIVVATCGGGGGAGPGMLAMGSGNNCLSMGSSGLCLAMGH